MQFSSETPDGVITNCTVEITGRDATGVWVVVWVDKQRFSLRLQPKQAHRYVVKWENRDHEQTWFVHQQASAFELFVAGQRLTGCLRRGSVATNTEHDHREGRVAVAPMPGRVVAVMAMAGSMVEKDQVLLVLESMKMENEIKSPMRGRINQVHVRAGEMVEQGRRLVTLAAANVEVA